MLVIITKVSKIVKDQFSRLKLHFHINKQSKKFHSKSRGSKFVIGVLTFVFLATILTIGYIIAQGLINPNLSETKDQIVKPVIKENELSQAEVKIRQIIFDKESYVELAEPTDNPNKAGSVNIRQTVCDSNIIGSANWKMIGQIVEGPITQECFDGKWNWYKVKWSNGAVGWSIDNYFNKIDAIRKFSSAGVELEYPFDWQITDSRDSKGVLTQILLKKAEARLIFNTNPMNAIIGLKDNNQVACIGGLTDITQKKESYRVNYGYHEIGENKEKTTYYKYVDKSEFFSRQNPNFETLYNTFLTKARDTVNSADTNKMPYIDLFDIQGCSKTISPVFSNVNIDGNNQAIYIDLQIKAQTPSSQIIEEADKIVLSLKKVSPKSLD